jgi:ribosomal protein S27E
MEDVVCPECNASISFASASMVASCTLCGADLDLPRAGPVEVQPAPAGQVSGD